MDALYRIYLESCIALSRSVVFYSSLAADVVNKQDIENGIIPSKDRRDWKYFKHLNGDYHWSDNEIKITSLDTHTEILYTKEVLSKHKKTLATYRDEPRHVRELIAKYPNQSMLIRGVINPIPYHISTKAEEGQVLWLDDKLIEPQEHSLRYDIYSFIAKFIHRNFRVSYTDADDLYLQTQYAVLKIHLAKRIQSFRNSKMRTAEAHSFHMTNYLASHNRLDQFLPYMSLEQKLFFYININWIERHIGFTESFDWLVEKLLTIRNLPAYSYRLVQKDPDLEENAYTPLGVFARSPINFNENGAAYTVDEYPIDSVIRREVPTATDNLNNLFPYIEKAQRQTNEAQISSLPTKIIECAVIDPESISAISELDVAVNHWLYLSTKGLYNATAEILNPVNGQTMRLDTRDMFTLYWYAMNTVVYGQPLDKIELVGAMSLNRHREITEDEYKTVMPWKTCPFWREEVSVFTNTAVVLEESITNKDEFSDYVRRVTQSMEYRNQWTNGEHYGPIKELRECLWRVSYANCLCDLSNQTDKTYAEFFDRIGLQWQLLSPDVWLDLAGLVFEASTAWTSKNSFSIDEVQKQMILCFKRLSSYRVQFIDDLIGNNNITGGNAYVGAGAITSSMATEIDAPIPDIGVGDLYKRTRQVVDCSVDIVTDAKFIRRPIEATASVDIVCDAFVNTMGGNDKYGSINAVIPSLSVGGDYSVDFGKDPSLEDYITDDELDGFILTLDPVQLEKCITAEQLRGFFDRLQSVRMGYVSKEPISPSRSPIARLDDLKFREEL